MSSEGLIFIGQIIEDYKKGDIWKSLGGCGCGCVAIVLVSIAAMVFVSLLIYMMLQKGG